MLYSAGFPARESATKLSNSVCVDIVACTPVDINTFALDFCVVLTSVIIH